jgi:hypothetical protein
VIINASREIAVTEDLPNPHVQTDCNRHVQNKNSVSLVRERTIPTERPSLIGEVGADFFADSGSRVVSAADPYGRILGFLDRSCYFFFQVPPQLYSQG